MIRLGLIRNPRSQRNRSSHGDMAGRAAEMLGLFYAEPATPAELTEVLADFARNEVGIIVVDGGDGTVREVLTALPEAYGDQQPMLSILASGKTNLIAADVGTTGHGTRAFCRLVEEARRGYLGSHIQRRPILEATWADGSRLPVRGMFMGTAAFTRGTALAQEKVHARGLYQAPAVALTIAGALTRALRGKDGWLDGEPMNVVADGSNGPDANRFLFLATTLHRLVLGIWPFWGEGREPIRYLDISAHPESLHRAVVPLMRGRPKPFMLADGYRSGVAEKLTLGVRAPFVIDGEMFDPGPGGTVHLSAGRSMDFVVP